MNLPKTIRTQSDDSRAQKHAVLPHNPKRHSASFRRVLVLVYGTVVLFALLITGIYTVVSPQIFASNKISDLIPKGQIIAGYIESTLRGELSSTYLVPLIGRSTSQWEATVWVVDASGDTLIRTQQIEGRRVGRLPAKLSGSMLPQVLSGEVATHVGSMEDLSVSANSGQHKSTQSSGVMDDLSENRGKAPETDSTEEIMSGKLVVVAVPITFMDDVIGAVFMAQSMTEIMGGMQALTNTLALSLLLVALLMLPIVLFFASRMVRPISRMRTVALTMAGGDLTVRAEDASNDEYGELGRALNYLSSELGRTISSLQMERNRLQSLINGLSEGIIAVDEKGATTLINPAVYNLLNRGTSRGKDEPLLDIRTAILHHDEGVDLLPSSLGLFSLELTMTGANARETILKRLLAPLKSQYDVILIDCAPTLGMFTLNSLSAADSILIPVSVNFLSIEGISQLLDTVMFIKQEINPDVIIEGIVLTMLDARTSYARGMVSLISNTYGNSLPIFNAQIPYSVRASEISALGCSIYAHNAKGKVARAYEKLVQEVIGHGI